MPEGVRKRGGSSVATLGVRRVLSESRLINIVQPFLASRMSARDLNAVADDSSTKSVKVAEVEVFGASTQAPRFDRQGSSKKVLKTVAKMDPIIAKYDKNGDGKFDETEVRAIVLEMNEEKRTSTSLRKIVAALLVALVLALGANFALIIVGMEVVKESRTDPKTGVVTAAGSGVPVVNGQVGFSVTEQSATRRRLKTIHGRSMVSVALVGSTCTSMISAARATHTARGLIELVTSSAAGTTTYEAGAALRTTTSGSTTTYRVRESGGLQHEYDIEPASDGTCTAYEEVRAPARPAPVPPRPADEAADAHPRAATASSNSAPHARRSSLRAQHGGLRRRTSRRRCSHTRT